MAGRISIGDIVVNLIARTANFERNLTRATKRLRKVARQWKRSGEDMVRSISLPLLAIGGFGVKAAMDFETAFIGVQKTVDGTSEQFKQLEIDIRNMSKELPVSAKAIAAVAQAAGQVGVKIQDIPAYTRVMIDLGEATDIAATDAAVALARFANILGIAHSEMESVGSALVALGNEFPAFESEIMEMGVRLSGAGRLAKMSADEVLGLGTALVSVGVQAQAGGTAMSKVMMDMGKAVMKGGENLRKWADAADMSVDRFSELFSRDAPQAILAFVDHLRMISDEGGNVYQVLDDLGLSERRVIDVVTRLTGANRTLRDSLKRASEAMGEGTSLTEEAQKRYESFNSKLKMLWNTVTDLAIEIGNQLIPHLKELIDEQITPGINKLYQLAASFKQLTPFVQDLAMAFAALAVILPFVVMGMGAVALAGGKAVAITLAIATVTATLAAMWKNWDTKLPPPIFHVPTINAVRNEYIGVALELAKISAYWRAFGDFSGPSLGDKIKEYVKQFQDFEDVIQGWGDTLAETLSQLIVDGGNWADAMKGFINLVIQEVIRLVLMLELIQPLVRSFQGSLGLPKTYGPVAPPPGATGEAQGFGGMSLAGAGGASVTVINNASSTGPARVEQTRGPMGRPMVKVIIEDAVEESLAGGRHDATLSRVFGLRRRGVRR